MREFCKHIGVIFDCDGTLLDTSPVWSAVEKELSHRAGVVLSEAQRDRLVTFTIPETGVFFHEQLGLGKNPADVVRMTDDLLLEHYQYHVQERPGALAFVRGLAELDIPICVASSSPLAYLQAGLAHTGFTEYLEAIVSVDEVGASKREPLVYDRACTMMGTAHEYTWVFEDAAYALRTVRKAGYRSVGVYDSDTSGSWEDLTALADKVISGFEDFEVAIFLEYANEKIQ